MAAITEGNEIIKMVSRFPITIEVAPRFDMVNIERLTNFFCGDTATLACEFIPFAGGPALPAPSWSPAIFVTAQPGWAFFAFRVSRFALPIQAAISIAKDVLINPAGQPHNGLAAIVASVLGPLDVLMVFRPANWIGFTIFLVTPLGAESEIESFGPVLFALGCFPACSANFGNPSRSRSIPAFLRAVFLVWMFAGRHEQFTTLWTRFHSPIIP